MIDSDRAEFACEYTGVHLCLKEVVVCIDDHLPGHDSFLCRVPRIEDDLPHLRDHALGSILHLRDASIEMRLIVANESLGIDFAD